MYHNFIYLYLKYIIYILVIIKCADREKKFTLVKAPLFSEFLSLFTPFYNDWNYDSLRVPENQS